MLSSPTASRISSSVDTTNILNLPFTSSCAAMHKVWEGRRKARRQLSQKRNPNLLELERQVSRMLLSDQPTSTAAFNLSESFNDSCSSTNSASSPIFEFSLTLEDASDSLSATFQPEASLTEFTTFFHHLEVFLPGFILKCLNS